MSVPIKSSHLGTLLQRLKTLRTKVEDAVGVLLDDPNLESTVPIIDVLKKQNKQSLCTNMLDVITKVMELKQCTGDIEETLKDYEIINSCHQNLTENIVKSIAEDAKTILQPDPPVQPIICYD